MAGPTVLFCAAGHSRIHSEIQGVVAFSFSFSVAVPCLHTQQFEQLTCGKAWEDHVTRAWLTLGRGICKQIADCPSCTVSEDGDTGL